MRRGAGRRAGDGRAEAPGVRRHPAPAAQGDRVPGAGPGLRALRRSHRRAAARRHHRAGTVRATGARPGREPGLRASCPGRPGCAAHGRHDGPAGLGGLDGRGAAQGGGQAGAVHGPRARAAAPGRGALCRRDPSPRRRAPGIRPRRLHRVPDRDAHRRPVRRRHRRRRRARTATPGSSSATATPATAISPMPCTPGARRTTFRDLRDLYTFDPDGQVWCLCWFSHSPSNGPSHPGL